MGLLPAGTFSQEKNQRTTSPPLTSSSWGLFYGDGLEASPVSPRAGKEAGVVKEEHHERVRTEHSRHGQ
jgi:hypothetical protein